jgi:molecular chaperone GrpE
MNKNIGQGKGEQEVDTQKNKQKQEKTITITEKEYNQLRQGAEKSKEYWEKILRLQADFDNTRKRLEREKQEFLRFANEGLIINLLNVIDDLERSLELAQEKHQDLPAFLKGIEMILAHLYDLLKEHGLSPIEAKGELFNPNYHEALLKVETEDFPEDTVVEELQKGYLLNGRVVRTAKVKVAKKKS